MASIYDANLMSIIMDYAYPPWENMLVLQELEELFRSWRDGLWEDVWSFHRWWVLHPLAREFARIQDYDYESD